MTTTLARGSPVGAGGAVRSSGSVSFPFLPGAPLGTMPVPPVQAASSTSLPSPSSVAAPRPVRFCVTSPTTSKPSVSHRRLSSFSDDRCSASVTPESCTPTSTALGRGASVGADMVVLRGIQGRSLGSPTWIGIACAASRRRLHAARARLVRLDRPRGIPAGFGGTPSVLNENTPHYDLDLLGSEGSHGPRRESPLDPE